MWRLITQTRLLHIRCAEVAETTCAEASTVEHLHGITDQIVVQASLKS